MSFKHNGHLPSDICCIAIYKARIEQFDEVWPIQLQVITRVTLGEIVSLMTKYKEFE
jgi:hypothetical protein